MSEAWMQIELFNRERPLLTSVFIFAIIAALLFGWKYIAAYVTPVWSFVTYWLSKIKPPVPATPGTPIAGTTSSASARDAALQVLFTDAMQPTAPDNAIDNIAVVAKAYKTQAAKVAP